MEIRIQKSSISLLPKYEDLYRACFPNATHLQAGYLSWLYRDNPAGTAIGADAVCGDKVVGQVIAIPGNFELSGKAVNGLVAVNVAVHPDFQGRHLFKKLGLQMCDYGAQQGYAFVTGVANAAATPGWIRQMGFQLVRPLEARVGIGGLGIKDYRPVVSASQLRRRWTPDALHWRANNPINEVSFNYDKTSNLIAAYTSAKKPGMSVFAEILMEGEFVPQRITSNIVPLLPRVFLGLIPTYQFNTRYFSIPEKLKPSPLNLIYKNLVDSTDRIDPTACFMNFLDFDAF